MKQAHSYALVYLFELISMRLLLFWLLGFYFFLMLLITWTGKVWLLHSFTPFMKQLFEIVTPFVLRTFLTCLRMGLSLNFFQNSMDPASTRTLVEEDLNTFFFGQPSYSIVKRSLDTISAQLIHMQDLHQISLLILSEFKDIMKAYFCYHHTL